MFKVIEVEVALFQRCEVEDYGSELSQYLVNECEVEYDGINDITILGDNEDDYKDIKLSQLKTLDRYLELYDFEVDEQTSGYYIKTIEIDTAIKINDEWYVW